MEITGSNTLVWTTVPPSGVPNHSECEGWLTDIPNPSPVGSLLHTDNNWTQGHTQAPCSNQLHIYCFEQ